MSVQGYAEDIDSDGYCALNRIRYKVKINGIWSDWQIRNIATTCGYGSAKLSTGWWSNYPTAQLEAQACLRADADSAAVHCSSWV